MSAPAFTAFEERTRNTFMGLMWALSYPGRVQDLPTYAGLTVFHLIAEALLDLETSYYTPDADLATHLSRTTARAETINRAEYIFYPQLQNADLAIISQASVGSMMFPDQAATLIIGCDLGHNAADPSTLKLTGPGLQSELIIQVGGLPGEFWTVRDQHRRFPLGWDIFLVSGQQVIGLPRSTNLSY